MSVPTILLTGPVGSGKTTVSFEMSRQLEAAQVGYALVDTDELDRVFPPPADDPHKALLTRRNLAAVWANLRAAGANRLILVMVAASLEYEMPHLREAVPEAEIITVRLRASEMTLLERLRRREVGSGLEYHRRRAVEQASLMDREEDRDGVLVVETTGKSVPVVAREVLRSVGWQL
jgi:broad-specificity NMP kinase